MFHYRAADGLQGLAQTAGVVGLKIAAPAGAGNALQLFHRGAADIEAHHVDDQLDALLSQGGHHGTGITTAGLDAVADQQHGGFTLALGQQLARLPSDWASGVLPFGVSPASYVASCWRAAPGATASSISRQSPSRRCP